MQALFVDVSFLCLFQVNILLQHQGDPTIENNHHKTPLDLSCEFGKVRVGRKNKTFI